LLPLEFTKLQELVYNLPIEHVMKKDVITVSPGTTIRQLKEILKTNRISGVPVLDDGHLIGIASIEDLIKALENGELNYPVSQRMTRELITVLETATVIEAVKKFSQSHVGRLLVVNDQGMLTGILTGSDITRGLLEAISLNYQSNEVQRDPRIIFREDIVSDQTSLVLRYRIKERDFQQGGRASSKIKHALERLGITPQILRRVAISAYEAEMNLIIHTEAGGELITEIQPDCIRLTVDDHGPGIPDVEQALRPGFSTAPAWIQELGFGAGMGLANIKKCADSFTIESTPGRGTKLEIMILIKE
jgi:CBS domain-containing protein/anti-sigma regulatory factor (Ser/Thr protein kinase)